MGGGARHTGRVTKWVLWLLAVSPASGALLADRIDWGQAAGNYELVGNPAQVTSAGGRVIVVGQPGAAFQRLDQSNGWYGNFTPGEELLWTYYGGPITLDFGAAGASAIYFQIQPDLYGAFTTLLEVLDCGGAVVGQASGSGHSSAMGDGSALALTLTNTWFQRARISLTVAADPTSFAIGTVGFTPALAANSQTVVPEPTAWSLAAAALSALIYGRWRSGCR